jgi:hypothetical protein
LVIKDLGPREDSGGAVILPEYGKVKTKFVVRGMQGGVGKALWEVLYFSACGCELSIGRDYCRRGKCHEAVGVSYFRVCGIYEESLFDAIGHRGSFDHFAGLGKD